MNLTEASTIAHTCADKYATAFDVNVDATWLMLKLHEEVGELTQAHLNITGQSRPRGNSDAEMEVALGDELADVLGMVLNIATAHGVDIEQAFRTKWGTHAR